MDKIKKNSFYFLIIMVAIIIRWGTVWVILFLTESKEPENTNPVSAGIEFASVLISMELEDNTENINIENTEINDISFQDENEVSEGNSEILSESAEPPEEIIEITEQAEIRRERYSYVIVRYRNQITDEILKWEISIYENQEFVQEITIEYERAVPPDFDEMIWEEDVNFDGVKDLLIHTGYYGVQGSQHYECYLADPEQNIFVWCPGFKAIPNPKVDMDNKLICGHSRRNASSYSKQFYQYSGSSYELFRADVYVYDDELGTHVYDHSYTKDDL